MARFPGKHLFMRLGILPLMLMPGRYAAAAPTQQITSPQQITLYVFRGAQKILGPDGKGHDAFVPASIVVHLDRPVTVTVINYDEHGHSVTAPGLGLDAIIKPGHEVGEKVTPVRTTFTFTPNKLGTFRWYCKIPCDAGGKYWAMGQGYGGPGKEGFMAGHIVVIA